ncbi:MAG: DNA topoisomerase [Clostridia bacterium]|nr:DNA topoisomerase [Clostridia bacterium]
MADKENAIKATTAKSKRKSAEEYNEQSIKSLKGPDRVRKRPAVIFGSDGLDGCEHAFFEILSNSVDEAREGYGKTIIVTAYSDLSIEVEDFGRGIPLGFNQRENRYNWELVFCELYAGGKYDNNTNGSYGYSLGLNGLGACATQYASEFMDVRSYKNGELSSISFRKGFPVTELSVEPLPTREAKRTGTVIRWKPDLEVFTSVTIPKEHFSTTMHKQAVVNAGVTFRLNWQNDDGSFSTEEYLYERGILDYVTELAGEDALTTPVFWQDEARGKDRDDLKEYDLYMSAAFCVSNTTQALEFFHNSSFLEHGGSPKEAVKNAFLYAVDKYLRDNDKYTKADKAKKLQFEDIADCLVVVTNCFSTQTSYENQTKKSINNAFITSAMTAFLKAQLNLFLTEKPQEAERFVNQVLINKRSREQAVEVRLSTKKKLTGTIDISNRVEKFINCRTKDPDKRELYIVEGDSAMSSCKLGRAAEFQAIIPVRGKTMNCMKSTYDKIFKSDIITDLLRVIGCGVELDQKVKSDIAAFDPEKLNWSKIIICTDADEDGFQIRALLLTLFHRLMPSLIKMGRVYIAESPLFEITVKDDIYFAYNEREKAQILARIGDAKYTLQRSKGLGENEAEMMWQTTMNPATRRLIQVTEADVAATNEVFDILLGDNIQERKVYIAENGHKYLAAADFS